MHHAAAGNALEICVGQLHLTKLATIVLVTWSAQLRHSMLTIWGRKSSFTLQNAMWLVGELRLAHRHIEVGGQFGGLDAPEFRAMNPHGKVPVLDDGGTVVWESHAILRYLAARYGRGSFWHDDPAAR